MLIRNVRLASLFLGVSLLLAACAPAAREPQPTTAQDQFQSLLAASSDHGPVAPNQNVSFLLLLHDDTQAQRDADLQALYDPRSPSFGQFETPAQLAATYGPSADAVAQARAVLAHAGLTADWQPGQGWLSVEGPAAAVETAFGVAIHDYVSRSGIHFYASAQAPKPPAALAAIVTAAGRIDSYPMLHSSALLAAVPEGGLAPNDLLKAYDMAPLHSQGYDGSGSTVVFIIQNPDGDSFKQADFDAFTQKYGLPSIQPKLIGAKPGNKVEGEIEMDMEVVHEIAPAASLVVYVAQPKTTDAQFVKLIQQSLTDNQHAIFSNSWGGCELQLGQSLDTAIKGAYDSSDQLGDTVFFSTGDASAYDCMTKDWGNTPPSSDEVAVESPASSPGVTAVGGTRLSVSADGSWYNETAWEEPIETQGTGGGLSAFFPLPSWQKGPGVKNQASNGERELPDVAADADPDSGVSVDLGGEWQPGGGTSLAAPIWAGITALMNQYLKRQGLHELGFLNPALYTLAASSQPYPPFHDITVGGNLVYQAGPGYNLATGLGTPDVWNLVRDLEAYQKSGGK